METELRAFENFDEGRAIGDLATLLYYTTQLGGVDPSTIITQLDDDSSTGPVQLIRDDVVSAQVE